MNARNVRPQLASRMPQIRVLCLAMPKQAAQGASKAAPAKAAAPKAAPKPAPKPAPAKAAAPPPKSQKPEKPTIHKAPSPYNLFVKDRMTALAKEAKKAPAGDPKASSNSAFKEAAAQWKTLSEVEKEPYKKQSDALKAEVAVKRDQVKAEKKKNARPVNAFVAYMTTNYDEYAKQHPGAKAAELAKIIGAAWKAMPEAEKAPLREKAKAELDAWKAAHDHA